MTRRIRHNPVFADIMATCTPLAVLGDPYAYIVFSKIAANGGRMAQKDIQRKLLMHKSELSRVVWKLTAAKLLTATTNLDRTRTVAINPEALARSIRQLVAAHERITRAAGATVQEAKAEA